MFGGVIVAERVCGYEDELAAAERRPGVGRRCARRCLLLLLVLGLKVDADVVAGLVSWVARMAPSMRAWRSSVADNFVEQRAISASLSLICVS